MSTRARKASSRGGVGKDGVDRVSPARSNAHDLAAVGQAVDQNLLDRQDLARLAALGLAELPVTSPLAQKPAHGQAQQEERTGDRDPDQLSSQGSVQERVHAHVPFSVLKVIVIGREALRVLRRLRTRLNAFHPAGSRFPFAGWKSAGGTLAEGTPLPAAGNPANLKAFVRGESSAREAFSLGVEES